MRLRSLFFIAIFALVGTTFAKDIEFSLISPTSVDDDVLLQCISFVETGGNISAVGKKGERSQYQFMRDTWSMHSRTSFWSIGRIQHQNEVERVAREHIDLIKMTLSERGLSESVYNIAMAWNGGPNKVRYSTVNREYAERVENLYNSSIRRSNKLKIEPAPVLRFNLDPNQIVFTVPGMIIAQVQPPYRIAGF